jgi:Family of unknown function (DUF5715)
MHAKGATAALIVLAWTQLWPGPLMAKPTRTIPRPTSSRSIIAQPAHRLATARRDQRLGTHAASRNAPAPVRHSATHSTARNLGADREAQSSLRIPKRAHSPAQERTLAAQAAIASANRGTRSRRGERTYSLPETRAHYALAETREARAPLLPSDGTATGDEPFADDEATPADLADNSFAPRLPHMKSIEEEASTPMLLPALRVSSLYDSRGRLMVPPPLYGSREILLHQNQMADRDGLDRVRDDADLLDLRRDKKLIALPDNETLRVDFRLPENRRYSRPWTAAFLAVLARDYYTSFHQPLQVDSAVRTVQVQQRLIRTNGNAAPSTGDTASPHLTGQAIDIAKRGLSITEIAWLRAYLLPLIGVGKIDVEEEFKQSCFHISVYKNYLPATPSHLTATVHQLPAGPLP